MMQSMNYIAVPDGGGPGVLVLHAWWGLSDGIRALCDAFAHAGFVALAPDLYAGARADTIAEAELLLDRIDEDAVLGRASDGFESLQGHPAVSGEHFGTVGVSMGAWYALRIATLHPAECAAAVLYYGTAPGIDHREHGAAVQGHFAGRDEWEPADDVDALEAKLLKAERRTEFHRYPQAGHWFAEADRPEAYDPAVASQAFQRTVYFLKGALLTKERL
jgi:carboxymethylenebutenolidase